MWALRVLSGSQAGQVFQLRQGQSLIGRASHCTIKLADHNISKEHASIYIEKNNMTNNNGGVVTLIDNNSRNGTFVNGTQVRKINLKKSDKIAFHEIFCDLILMPTKQVMSPQLTGVHRYPPSNQIAPPPIVGRTEELIDDRISNEGNKFQKYLDEVLLPGVYRLTDVMEFKLVVGLFLILYAFMLTALSTIPMLAITTESIQIESRRRALTIARNLANTNQQALMQENEAALNTNLAEIEEGVAHVYIINQSSGAIMAPATKTGSVPGLPFIETARREQKEFIQQIDSSHIGVSVPLSSYNPETGGYNVKALAIIIYDMGTLAVEDGRTVSLFMQILFISILLGLILYFLFNKLIEYPIRSLNNEVDLAIKNKSETTNFSINFPIFEQLITNVNTLLNRVAHIKEEGQKNVILNKEIEASNLLLVIGYASIALNRDLNIIGVNGAFEAMLNVSDAALKNQPISLIPDQAFQKNIIELIQRVEQDPSNMQLGELEFGGVISQISCLAISESNGVSYFVSSIVPMASGSE